MTEENKQEDQKKSYPQPADEYETIPVKIVNDISPLQTDNMEVHHHTHTEHKKFKHYLWEFFMLFLAVFCGFLAEIQVEHYIDHQREKEYMQSLVEDLNSDTLELNNQIPFGQVISNRIENLVNLLNMDPFPKDSTGKLYLLNVKAGRVVRMRFEDRTSSQLKNAGNMRLIRNKQVADSIRNYWGMVSVIEDIGDRLETIRGHAGDLNMQLFYNKFIQYSDKQNPLQSDVTILPGAKLINDDPKLLAEYANRRNSSMFVLNNYIVSMIEAKAMAQRLITLIKNEYHLE